MDLLVKHSACDDVALHDLLRTPRMQQHLASFERRLSRAGVTADGQRKSKVQGAGPAPLSPHALARYDREQLYNEVWSAPAQKVAERYAVSGVFLGRVCRQLKIPKPPRGYWAKKAAGGRVPAPPKVPPLDDKRGPGRKRRP